MSKATRARKGISFAVTVAMVALIAAVLWWRGDGFYQLDLDARIDHPEYRELRSSGDLGYFYGLAGTFLIITNLLYLVRRKLASRKLGSMKTWLDLHVFTGLSGTAFIAFHSTFQARSLMAQITVASLAVVVVTGIIGRYIYRMAHRSGDPVREVLARLETQAPGVKAEVLRAFAHMPLHRLDHHASLLRVLVHIPRWRREGRARRKAAVRILRERSAPGLKKKYERRLARAVRRGTRTAISKSLLGAWRPLHRFFAILMLLVVVVHIGVAWHYGYRWIFSS